MAAPSQIPRSDWLGYLLRISASRVVSAFNSAFHAVGLDMRSYHILYLASLQNEPFNQASVAAILNINQNIVSEIVKDLSERNFIRQATNPHNKREKFLRLTEEGRALMAKATELGEAVQNDLLSSLEPTEQKEFIRLLRKFSASWFMGPR